MKDFLLIVGALSGVAMVVYFVVLVVKDILNRQRTERNNLFNQIEQYKKIIRENKENSENEAKKKERERISRDIHLAFGYKNDKLVDIIIEYCPCKLMSAKNLSEMKKQIKEAEDDYYFDNFLKETYLPIIGHADFWMYHSEMQQLKPIIRLHKELTPQDVIDQINFYRQNDSYNMNELELLSCLKSIYLQLDPYDDYAFFTDSEVEQIAQLIADRFDFEIEDFLYPGDHSSYHRSILGINRIFAKLLFNDVYSQLSILDEDVFIDIIEQYFFYEVCYDIYDFGYFLPEIISYVKEHRSYIC